MKNSDEAIDKVLAGLREVEAPAGMERRILQAMEARAAARSPRVPWLAGYWPVACGAALACGLVALFALRSPNPTPPAPAPMQAIVQPQDLPIPVEPTPAKPHRRSPAIRENAEGNVQTASFPAPPMPLTEQERLLLQIARRGEPKAAPVLDPNALAAQESHSEQAFEAFLASAQEPSIMKHKEDIR